MYLKENVHIALVCVFVCDDNIHVQINCYKIINVCDFRIIIEINLPLCAHICRHISVRTMHNTGELQFYAYAIDINIEKLPERGGRMVFYIF